MSNSNINDKTINVNELLQKELDLNLKYSQKFLDSKKNVANNRKEEYNDEFEDENKKSVDFGFNGAIGVTIEQFLEIVCNRNHLTGRWIHSEVTALNENKDKIKNIVDCVMALDETTIENLIPKQMNISIDKLSERKTYMILCLIEFGINPFEIKIYLESDSNNDFNWNNFLQVIEKRGEKWLSVCSKNYLDSVDISSSIVIVELINVFTDLLDSGNNLPSVNIETVINIFRVKPSHIFKAEPSCGFLCFIWFYLNKDTQSKDIQDIQIKGHKQTMKEFLLGIPDGFIFKNFFSQKSKDGLLSKNETKTEVDLHDIRDGDFGNTDFQHDFYNLIEKLDQVTIGVFCLILMRNISFTDEQMNFIAKKINNVSAMVALRQINQSLDYKKYNADTWECNGKDNKRRVKFGLITHALDYVFLKIFRGIGYLGAILWALVHYIPYALAAAGMGFVCAYLNASCGGFLCLLLPFWSAFAIGGGFFLLMFTVIYIIRHFSETQLFSWRAESCNFRDWWSEFPDNMQDFYNDSKIVEWLELYNLKHPTNNIGLLRQPIISVPVEPGNTGANIERQRENNGQDLINLKNGNNKGK